MMDIKKIMIGHKVRSFLFVILFVAGYCASVSISASDGNVPHQGYVPNKETAIKIAEAIWLPIYGDEIYDSKPFIAELSKDKKVWKVSGTLLPGVVGGAPYAEIRKSDCKVLKVMHGE